jgi:hypothetical protein
VGIQGGVPGVGYSAEKGEIIARDNGYWKSGRGTILKVIELFKDVPLHISRGLKKALAAHQP